MQITNEQYINIQAFLDGVMTEEQKLQFKSELSSNAALNEYFEFEEKLREDAQSIQEKKELYSLYDQLSDSIKAEENNHEIKNIIEEAGLNWKKENQNKLVLLNDYTTKEELKSTRIVYFKPWLFAAAAGVLIVLLSINFLFNPQTDIGDLADKNAVNRNGGNKQLAELYNLYYRKDTVPRVQHPLRGKALSDYENNDYTSLQEYDLINLPNLKGLENQKQEVLELGYYYKGISYLQTEDFEKANASFMWVIDSAAKEDLKDKAKWYLALSNIRTGDIETAMKWLNILSTDKNAGEFREKATALFKKLKETGDGSK